jgi:hypothetical protein
MGDHPEHLLDLAMRGSSRRAVVIANAMDDAPPDVRRAGVERALAIERVVARYRADGIPYRALHDGQALLINGPQTMIV